jgi:antitoxin component of MazEF toxin-antitoxin module
MLIKKWGNSLATRIPKAIVESIDLHIDQEVEIEAVNGRIIITPVKERNEYKLDELLSQCTSEKMNLNEEDQNWLNALPVGKESW